MKKPRRTSLDAVVGALLKAPANQRSRTLAPQKKLMRTGTKAEPGIMVQRGFGM